MKRWENEGGGRRRIEEASGGGAANVHGWVISATNNLPDMYVCVLVGIFFFTLCLLYKVLGDVGFCVEDTQGFFC